MRATVLGPLLPCARAHAPCPHAPSARGKLERGMPSRAERLRSQLFEFLLVCRDRAESTAPNLERSLESRSLQRRPSRRGPSLCVSFELPPPPSRMHAGKAQPIAGGVLTITALLSLASPRLALPCPASVSASSRWLSRSPLVALDGSSAVRGCHVMHACMKLRAVRRPPTRRRKRGSNRSSN